MANRLKYVFNNAVTIGLAAAALALPVSAQTPSPNSTDNDINQALLDRARENASDILASTSTPYSADLAALEKRVNDYLKTSGRKFHETAIVFDPTKYDTARALGLSMFDAIKAITPSAQKTASNPILDLSAAESLEGAKITTAAGVEVQLNLPHAFSTFLTSGARPGAAPSACFIVPATDFIAMVEVPGLTAEETRLVTNNHEGYHCLSDKYIPPPGMEKRVSIIASSSLPTAEDRLLVYEYMSLSTNNEAFSDVASVGDVIRAGGRLGLIEPFATWRENLGALNYAASAPALRGLNAEITAMGITSFKKLTDIELLKFYEGVVDKYGISTREMGFIFELQNNTPDIAQHLKEEYPQDPAVTRAIAFKAFLKPESNQPPPRTAIDVATKKQVQDWDAADALKKRAFSMAGKITPETLVGAYAAMQSGFYQRAKEAPADPLSGEMAAKLKSVYSTVVQETDYAAANRRYGVDIGKTVKINPPKPDR